MNTELLTRLVRIQSELNAIMIEIASQSTSAPVIDSTPVPVTESEKKGPGRPRKEKKERDPNKPKKVLSPEHLAKLKEGRDLAAAKKAEEKAAVDSNPLDSNPTDDGAKSVATEDNEIKVVEVTPPNAPKKGRGRPSKVTVEAIPAPDFSSADTT